MKRFIEGVDRGQRTLFSEHLDDWVGEDNPVGVIDVFIDELDLGGVGFERAEPEATGRPGYHPAVLLKLYVYGYLNRVQSSRRPDLSLSRKYRTCPKWTRQSLTGWRRCLKAPAERVDREPGSIKMTRGSYRMTLP